MALTRSYEVREIRDESGTLIGFEARSVDRWTRRTLESYPCGSRERATRVAQAMRTLDVNAVVSL